MDNSTPPKQSDMEAADWLLTLQSSDDDSLRDQFDGWLLSSGENQQAWKRCITSWQLLSEVQNARKNIPDSSTDNRLYRSSPAPTHPGIKLKHRRSLLGFAFVALFFSILWPSIRTGIHADFSTIPGEISRIELEDGSTLLLSGNSAVKAYFSETERRIDLLKGQAFFDVVKDPTKPFIVHAEGTQVSVLGTSFEIEIFNSGAVTRVGVATGKVSVKNNHRQHLLTPGDVLSTSKQTDNKLVGMPINSIAAWRQQRLFLRNQTLHNAIESIGRHYHGVILMLDDSLGDRSVTGSYHLNDVDQALEALVKPYNGRVIKLSPFIRVLTSS